MNYQFGSNLLEDYILNAYMPQMEKSDAYRKGSGAAKKWDGGGPGGPGGGPYGGGPRGPPRGLDNVRGLDHSKSILYPLFILIIIFSFKTPRIAQLTWRPHLITRMAVVTNHPCSSPWGTKLTY